MKLVKVAVKGKKEGIDVYELLDGVRNAGTTVVVTTHSFEEAERLADHLVIVSDGRTVDFTELEDARWFTREEVASALAHAEDPPFLPPPRHAIARTLLDEWLAA